MLHTIDRRAEQPRDTAAAGMPPVLRRWLPPHILLVLSRVDGVWEELHLRVDKACSVVADGTDRRLPLSFRRSDMEALMLRLCDGSLYAYRESINRGYLSPGGGVRVGLCGTAYHETGEGGQRLYGVRDIDAVCIRFPRPGLGVGRPLLPAIRRAFPRGTLIYAPPGVGKTTLLRALAAGFGRGPRPCRVALVDDRRELWEDRPAEDAAVSVLSGYPPGRGIEIAARSLNAQLIICDEIGNPAEAAAILGAANCGVPVLASAHGADLAGLLSRPGFDALHRAGVFGLYVGLARRHDRLEYDYTITPWEAVDHGT